MNFRVKCSLCKEILNCNRDDTDTLLAHIRQQHTNLETKTINGKVKNKLSISSLSSNNNRLAAQNQPQQDHQHPASDSNESFKSLLPLSQENTSEALSSLTSSKTTGNIRKTSPAVVFIESTKYPTTKTAIGHNKDKTVNTPNKATKLQQKPLTKSKLEEIDKHIESTSNIIEQQQQVLGQPLNQTDVDKIPTRQSFDENKLSSDALTIASTTTMPILDKRKSSVCDINKLPTIQKQEETVMKKDSLLLSTLSSSSPLPTIDNSNIVDVKEKTPINRHNISSINNCKMPAAKATSAASSQGKSNDDDGSNEKIQIQRLREEIQKIILKNNVACRCKIDKMSTKNAGDDNKFTKYNRNHKKRFEDMNLKLPTVNKPDWKQWKNVRHCDRRYLYKTTVENWRPGPVKITCPKCGATKIPFIRSHTDRVSHSKLGAACLLTCWPFCFMPFLFPPPLEEVLHCSACNHYLGIYSHRDGTIQQNCI